MTKVLHESTLDEVADSMIKRMMPILSDVAYAKYEGQLVTSEVACEILKISLKTLYRYIKDGRVVPAERDGALHFFDLKYLLQFNQ